MTILEFNLCSECRQRICKSPVTGNWFHWESGDTFKCCKYHEPLLSQQDIAETTPERI